jgi:hypothetical protein
MTSALRNLKFKFSVGLPSSTSRISSTPVRANLSCSRRLSNSVELLWSYCQLSHLSTYLLCLLAITPPTYLTSDSRSLAPAFDWALVAIAHLSPGAWRRRPVSRGHMLCPAYHPPANFTWCRGPSLFTQFSMRSRGYASHIRHPPSESGIGHGSTRDVPLHQHSGPYPQSSDENYGIGLFWREEDERRPLTHRGSLAYGLASAVHRTVHIHDALI